MNSAALEFVPVENLTEQEKIDYGFVEELKPLEA
jgi:hypothetical protein